MCLVAKALKDSRLEYRNYEKLEQLGNYNIWKTLVRKISAVDGPVRLTARFPFGRLHAKDLPFLVDVFALNFELPIS